MGSRSKCVHYAVLPPLNGKVERSHPIDQEEFYRLLESVVNEGIGGYNDKLQEWENFYNYHRPHGALGGQSPHERLRDKFQIALPSDGTG